MLFITNYFGILFILVRILVNEIIYAVTSCVLLVPAVLASLQCYTLNIISNENASVVILLNVLYKLI